MGEKRKWIAAIWQCKIARQYEQTLVITRGGGVSVITKPSWRFVVAFHQGNEEQHYDLIKFQGIQKKRAA